MLVWGLCIMPLWYVSRLRAPCFAGGIFYFFVVLSSSNLGDCAFNGDNMLCPICRSRVQDGLSKQKEQ